MIVMMRTTVDLSISKRKLTSSLHSIHSNNKDRVEEMPQKGKGGKQQWSKHQRKVSRSLLVIAEPEEPVPVDNTASEGGGMSDTIASRGESSRMSDALGSKVWKNESSRTGRGHWSSATKKIREKMYKRNEDQGKEDWALSMSGVWMHPKPLSNLHECLNMSSRLYSFWMCVRDTKQTFQYESSSKKYKTCQQWKVKIWKLQR